MRNFVKGPLRIKYFLMMGTFSPPARRALLYRFPVRSAGPRQLNKIDKTEQGKTCERPGNFIGKVKVIYKKLGS
jgi:hypothetical protein